MQQPYEDAAKTAGENPGPSYTSSYYEGGVYPYAAGNHHSHHTTWPTNNNAGYEASYTVEVNPAPVTGNSSSQWRDPYYGGGSTCSLSGCRANYTSHYPTTSAWPEAVPAPATATTATHPVQSCPVPARPPPAPSVKAVNLPPPGTPTEAATPPPATPEEPAECTEGCKRREGEDKNGGGAAKRRKHASFLAHTIGALKASTTAPAAILTASGVDNYPTPHYCQPVSDDEQAEGRRRNSVTGLRKRLQDLRKHKTLREILARDLNASNSSSNKVVRLTYQAWGLWQELELVDALYQDQRQNVAELHCQLRTAVLKLGEQLPDASHKPHCRCHESEATSSEEGV